MTLADDVLKGKRALSGNPSFVSLTDGEIAMCQALEKRLRQYQKRKLPKGYALDYVPPVTARGRSRIDDL